MYSKIVNPVNGKKVNLQSKMGEQIIRNYIRYVNQSGGAHLAHGSGRRRAPEQGRRGRVVPALPEAPALQRARQRRRRAQLLGEEEYPTHDAPPAFHRQQRTELVELARRDSALAAAEAAFASAETARGMALKAQQRAHIDALKAEETYLEKELGIPPPQMSLRALTLRPYDADDEEEHLRALKLSVANLRQQYKNREERERAEEEAEKRAAEELAAEAARPRREHEWVSDALPGAPWMSLSLRDGDYWKHLHELEDEEHRLKKLLGLQSVISLTTRLRWHPPPNARERERDIQYKEGEVASLRARLALPNATARAAAGSVAVHHVGALSLPPSDGEGLEATRGRT